MEYLLFIKALRGPNYNAFSDKFNIDHISKLFDKIKNDTNIDKALLLIFIIGFNTIYTDYFKQVKKIIDNTSTNDILEQFYRILNRDYIDASQIMKRESENVFSIRHYSNKRVKGLLGTSINAIEVIESAADSLNVLLRYLSYHQDNFKKISFEEIVRIKLLTDYYYSKKALYDYIVWEENIINFDNDQFVIIPINEEEKKLRFINQHRFNELLLITSLYIRQDREKYKNSPSTRMRRIKSARINKGLLEIIYAKGTTFCDRYFQNEAVIVTYYFYLDKINIENCKGLHFDDIIYMFSILQTIFDRIDLNQVDTTIKDISDLQKFPNKITYNSVIELLEKQGRFTIDQIRFFINLLIAKWTESDLYDNPFRKIKEYIYFALISIKDANLAYLLDIWIEKIGYNLDKRGNIFEDYLKDEIQRSLSGKGYFFNILPSKEIKINNCTEEIDIALELKNIILIFEVKCIKYPSCSRDLHNMRNRLLHGINQVKRKRDFIVNNSKYLNTYFKKSNKEVIACVITNFPHYSGMQFDGVFIIDQILLNNFLSNEYGDRKVTVNQGSFQNESSLNNSNYYNNEDEFSVAFEAFIRRPRPVISYEDKIESYFEIRSIREIDYDISSKEFRFKKEHLDYINSLAK